MDQKTVHARDDEDKSIHPDTLRHDDDDHDDDDGFVTVFEVFLTHSISTPKRTKYWMALLLPQRLWQEHHGHMAN